MLFDGLDADSQRSANLLVTQAQRDVTQHLRLAVGQRDLLVAKRLTTTHRVGDLRHGAAFDRRLAGCCAANRGEQFLATGTLEDVIAGAQRDRTRRRERPCRECGRR